MKNVSSSEYLMESTNENHRLSSKVDPIQFIHQYLVDRISNHTNILDVGCGPAVIDEQLAQSYPNANIVGIDVSSNRLIQASQNIKAFPNLKLLSANLYDLPFNNNSFHFVFARMVFEYLKFPLKAISELKRVCRPDGHVMIQDIDGQFLQQYPVNIRLFEKVNKIFSELNEQTGFDPFVGRKLYYYFSTSRFQNIQVLMEPYHLLSGKINSKDYVYWEQKLFSVLPKLSQYSQMTPEEIQEVVNSYLDYLKNKETFTFSNLLTVYGKK